MERNNTRSTVLKQKPVIEYSPNFTEIKLSYEPKTKPSERMKISSSLNSYTLLREIFKPEIVEHHEEFVIILLNRNGKLLGWAKISIGGIDSTVVDTKVIFQIALSANASSIILSHNHPSGNKLPSGNDTALTKNLKEAGKILDIDVIDHIIYTSEGYFSMMDEGIF